MRPLLFVLQMPPEGEMVFQIFLFPLPPPRHRLGKKACAMLVVNVRGRVLGAGKERRGYVLSKRRCTEMVVSTSTKDKRDVPPHLLAIVWPPEESHQARHITGVRPPAFVRGMG